ncbi:hypothetical protein AB0C93_29810 [Streptomyces sp. NPDC048518]|uniref:hypothetical protein n=1 Tax=Streptomyces sp. NPDC048518 TaxID=3155029 RepID=UPI0033FB5BCA
MELEPKAIVLLLAGACAAYVAYVHPAVGTAVLVGVGVATLLYLLMGAGGGEGPPTCWPGLVNCAAPRLSYAGEPLARQSRSLPAAS